MKKISALVTLFALIIGLIPAQVQATQITDPNSWANTPIQYAITRGWIVGDENGNVNPEGTMSRAEFITMMCRMRGLTPTILGDNPFADVYKGTWYYNYIMAGLMGGLIEGNGDGTFNPDGTISRVESVVVMARAYGIAPSTKTGLLNDEDTLPDWAKGLIIAMAENSFVKGDENGNFNPNDSITFGEFSQVSYNRTHENSGKNVIIYYPGGTNAGNNGQNNSPEALTVYNLEELIAAQTNDIVTEVIIGAPITINGTDEDNYEIVEINKDLTATEAGTLTIGNFGEVDFGYGVTVTGDSFITNNGSCYLPVKNKAELATAMAKSYSNGVALLEPITADEDLTYPTKGIAVNDGNNLVIGAGVTVSVAHLQVRDATLNLQGNLVTGSLEFRGTGNMLPAEGATIEFTNVPTGFSIWDGASTVNASETGKYLYTEKEVGATGDLVWKKMDVATISEGDQFNDELAAALADPAVTEIDLPPSPAAPAFSTLVITKPINVPAYTGLTITGDITTSGAGEINLSAADSALVVDTDATLDDVTVNLSPSAIFRVNTSTEILGGAAPKADLTSGNISMTLDYAANQLSLATGTKIGLDGALTFANVEDFEAFAALLGITGGDYTTALALDGPGFFSAENCTVTILDFEEWTCTDGVWATANLDR
ncbi:MAG: S-layer homology domain-containing protein [Clostridiales bacterium]|jgi:hypothetical protein|nr:S-layer homology domain-containing protein [Clostridiales bacterium]